MCGIVGFNWDERPLLKDMCFSLEHRGPDDFGYYVDKGISIGHRRLSIIDLSKAGNQPLCNENKTLWIVYNGEIYNFKKIRTHLETAGHNFISNTDTEVVLHAYEEYGTDCLNLFNGMFAFAIYDSEKKKLFLARDRIGIKPLYFFLKEGKFAFASELKALFVKGVLKKEFNMGPLSSFLTFRANTTEQSFFKNVNKLKSGHYLTFDLKTRELQIEKYWDFSYKPEYKKERYFSQKLLELLEDSVKSRLMSDVPYGAYLSGGVDSGTIVSLMSQFCSNPVNTFSVGFEEEDHCETKEARFLSENLNTNHHELLIGQSSIKHLPEILYHADEPMADPTSIPIYLLSEYAKKRCTVILTGEGSDEIFAGYPQYKFMKINQFFLKKLPIPIKDIGVSSLKIIPGKILDKYFKFASSLGEEGITRFSNFIKSNSLPEQYLNLIAIFNEKEQSELLDNEIKLFKKYVSFFKEGSSRFLDGCQMIDFKESMVDDLLMKVDKNTMAFSVEGRVPFLDHRIVELSSKLPNTYRLNGFNHDKYILRKTVKNLIPKQTRFRKKKHFFVPIDNWFKDELSSLKENLLSETYIRNQKIFDYTYIKKINSNFNKSKLFYSRQLWSLLTFQIWYKQFIEDEKVRI